MANMRATEIVARIMHLLYLGNVWFLPIMFCVVGLYFNTMSLLVSEVYILFFGTPFRDWFVRGTVYALFILYECCIFTCSLRMNAPYLFHTYCPCTTSSRKGLVVHRWETCDTHRQL